MFCHLDVPSHLLLDESVSGPTSLPFFPHHPRRKMTPRLVHCSSLNSFSINECIYSFTEDVQTRWAAVVEGPCGNVNAKIEERCWLGVACEEALEYNASLERVGGPPTESASWETPDYRVRQPFVSLWARGSTFRVTMCWIQHKPCETSASFLIICMLLKSANRRESKCRYRSSHSWNSLPIINSLSHCLWVRG